MPVTLGTWKTALTFPAYLWALGAHTSDLSLLWEMRQETYSLWFLLRVIVSGISVGPWLSHMQWTNALKSGRSESWGNGACRTPCGVGAPVIQLEIFWIHKTPGESLGPKGWLLGRANILVPRLHLYILQGQEDKSFARRVNENKCFMVWWGQGGVALAFNSSPPPPSWPGPT